MANKKINQLVSKTAILSTDIFGIGDATTGQLFKKTIAELRKEAQTRKLPNIWKLRRAELVELLYPSSEQNNQNNDDGKEHDNPEKGESDKVRIHVLKNTE